MYRASCVLFLTACLFPTVSADDLPAALHGFHVTHPEPIFQGRPGKWDELIRERGWVMRTDTGYRMWYTGYNRNVDPYDMKLGYATSPDGLNWTRYSDGPIFDDVWVEDMMIVQHADKLLMFAEGAADQAQLLESSDGVKWTRIGRLDIRLTNGQPIAAGPFGTPTAWHENGLWYLFYERRDQGIWLATSKDMKTWTNFSDDPLITPGPDSYDSLMIAMNQIVKINGRYFALMHGTGSPTKPRDWCTYFAVSDDLKTWKKCEEGPVLPVKDNRSSGVLVESENGFRLYTMHAEVHVHEPLQHTRQ